MQQPSQKPTKLNPASNIDYKELQKTLIQFQRAQLELEKTRQGSPLKSVSPVREMINFQALQDAGLIELNEKSKQVDGVKITLEEIEKAFKILDDKNKGTKISLLELKKKIPAINPNFPKSEVKALTQGKAELKSKDLYELLKQNELQDFDPLEQAFNLLDPSQKGELDIQRLGEVFGVLGYGKIDKRDIEILYECLDLDKDGKIGLRKKQMNIDKLLDQIVAEIYDYDVLALVQQYLFEISSLYNENQNQNIDVQSFIIFFVKKVDESGMDAIILVTRLVGLYQEMKAKSNASILKLKHITDYLVNSQDNHIQDHFNAKFLPKQTIQTTNRRKLIDAEIAPPQILGLNPSMLLRAKTIPEIIDVHSNKNIIQTIIGHKNQELFVLFQFSDSIQLFKQFNFVKNIEIVKKQDGNFIQQIVWSTNQQRLAALLRNNQISFWDRNDNYVFDFQIQGNIDLSKVMYLELQDVWVTISKTQIIQIWDIGTSEFQILQNQVFQYGIVQIIEIMHLQMLVIASLPSNISCWDMFEQKLLFKFTTTHAKLHQMITSHTFQLLFTIGFDNFISCYQLHTRYNDQNLVCVLKGHSTTINCIELIPDTAILASIDCKNIIILWDIRSKTQHQIINLTTRIMTIQLLAYNHRLCFLTNKLQSLSFEKQEIGQKIPKLIQVIYDQWNQRNIIATRADIRIQNIMTGKIDYILSDFNDEISAVCLIEHGHSIMTGTSEGNLLKINTKNGEVLQIWENIMQQEISKITYDEQASLLHIMSAESTCKCLSLTPLNVRKDDLNVKDKRAVRQLMHNNPINLCTISTTHGLLANSFDTFIQIWNLEYYSVISQIQLEEGAVATALTFCDTLPILILATSGSDIYFFRVQQRNEHYICTIEGHLNIVKSTLIKKLKQKSGKTDRVSVINNLFQLTSQQLIEIYDDKDQEIKIHHVHDNKYKLVTFGSHAVQLLVDSRTQNKLQLYIATNKGVAQVFDLTNLLKRETVQKLEPVQQRPNYNPYRVIYNNYEEHFIDNYKIVQGRLIKDLQFKTEMKTINSKIKQKFRMGMIRLSVLKGLKDNIEPDISQSSLDSQYSLDDTLLSTEKIHNDYILQLSFIQIDPYEILFQQQTELLLTACVDETIKLFTTQFELLCEINVRNPTPTLWNPILDQTHKTKAQILFALELLQQILPGLSPQKQEAYSIEYILRSCSIKNLKQKNKTHEFGVPLTARQSPNLILRGSLPQLANPTSLRFYSEKMKFTKQQKEIQVQEKQKEISNQKRSQAIKNEQFRIQKKELLDYFSVDVKENKEDEMVQLEKEEKEEKIKERLKTDKSHTVQTSKITRTTNYTDHNRRTTTEMSTLTQDFFDYADSKEFLKTSANFKQNRYSTRIQHKEFHKIVNKLHTQLKFFKNK